MSGKAEKIELNQKSGNLSNSNAQTATQKPVEERTKKQLLEEEAMNIIMQDMFISDANKTLKEIAMEKLTNKERAIRKLRQRIKINDTFAAILALSGMVIALVEYNIYHEGDGVLYRPSRQVYTSLESSETYLEFSLPRRNITTPLTTTLRSIVSISTAVLMIPLFYHMILNYKLSVLTGKTVVGTNILKTRFFRTFLFEVVINLIHSPPFIDATFTFTQIGYLMTYSLDLFLSNIMIFRIYLALRLFAHYTKWRSELSMKYCEKEGCEANTVFAMKASLNESPYLSLLLAFIVSSVVLGIPVKNFEEPLNEYSASPQKYTLWNAVWLIIITMTTVGFGDYFARSHIGRICSVMSIFWGIFLTSLMVVTLTNSMSLDAKESRAFNILYRLKARRNLEDKATFIATLIIRARALSKDNERRKEGLDPSKPADAEKLNELEQKYDNEKAEIYSKLDIFKSMFNEAFSNLKSADEDPVEEIRKLSLSIEHDFNEMRNFFIAIKEIEANLMAVHKSHEVIEKVIEQCKAYNQLFNKEIVQYKGGIFDIDKKKGGEGSVKSGGNVNQVL